MNFRGLVAGAGETAETQGMVCCEQLGRDSSIQMLLANSVQCDWLYRGSPPNLGDGGEDGSWTAGGGFPVISRNGMGAPGKEVRLSRGSEVLGMTFLGAVTVQAPGLFSDPAEEGLGPKHAI